MFYRAVINSHARLTYTQVANWLSNNKVESQYQELWPMLQEAQELYKLLYSKRLSRGAIDFDTTETKIVFDDLRKIKQIIPVVRNDAHRLIEEFMLTANVAVAKFLKKTKIPMLYRVHNPPSDDKISALRDFLGEFGIVLTGGKNPGPKDFQKALITNITDTATRFIPFTFTLSNTTLAVLNVRCSYFFQIN